MWKSDKSHHPDGQRGHRGSRAMKYERELATPRRHCRWGRTWPFCSWPAPERAVGTSCHGLALPWGKSVAQPTWTECLLETIPKTATTLDSCRRVKIEFTSRVCYLSDFIPRHHHLHRPSSYSLPINFAGTWAIPGRRQVPSFLGPFLISPLVWLLVTFLVSG